MRRARRPALDAAAGRAAARAAAAGAAARGARTLLAAAGKTSAHRSYATLRRTDTQPHRRRRPRAAPLRYFPPRPQTLALSFSAGLARRVLRLSLPVPPTKFCAPVAGLPAPAFFGKWNGLGAPGEAQRVVALRERPASMAPFAELAAKGLRLAVLPGVDPCATNLVALGSVCMKGGAAGEGPLIALRLEINVQVRALAARSARPAPRLLSSPVADRSRPALASSAHPPALRRRAASSGAAGARDGAQPAAADERARAAAGGGDDRQGLSPEP